MSERLAGGRYGWLYMGVLRLSDEGVLEEVDPGVRGEPAVAAGAGEAGVSESMSTLT